MNRSEPVGGTLLQICLVASLSASGCGRGPTRLTVYAGDKPVESGVLAVVPVDESEPSGTFPISGGLCDVPASLRGKYSCRLHIAQPDSDFSRYSSSAGTVPPPDAANRNAAAKVGLLEPRSEVHAVEINLSERSGQMTLNFDLSGEGPDVPD